MWLWLWQQIEKILWNEEEEEDDEEVAATVVTE